MYVIVASVTDSRNDGVYESGGVCWGDWDDDWWGRFC